MKKQEETKQVEQVELAANAAEYKGLQAEAKNLKWLLLNYDPYSCLRFLKNIFLVVVALEE